MKKLFENSKVNKKLKILVFLYKQIAAARKSFHSIENLPVTNLLFSSSFSSAELAALDISGGVPSRQDDVALKIESPELQPCGIVGTRKYLEKIIQLSDRKLV